MKGKPILFNGPMVRAFRTGYPSLAPCDRPASQVVKVPSGRASISSATKRPSLRGCTAAPLSPFLGAAFKFNWLGREASKILAKVWVLVTGKSEAQGRRDARPARAIYSAIDHWLHGTAVGALVGCAFFTWLEIFA